MPTAWISVATEESANMNALVSASVRCGSPWRPRVVLRRTQITRSEEVSPSIGRPEMRLSARSNSRPRAETSRWIFEGK